MTLFIEFVLESRIIRVLVA